MPPAVRMSLPTWFDNQEEIFSHKEVWFKTILTRKFGLKGFEKIKKKNSCLPAENGYMYETPGT